MMPGGLLTVRQGMLQDPPVGRVGAAPMLERLRPVHDGADAGQHAARRLVLLLQIGSMTATTSRTPIMSTGISPSSGRHSGAATDHLVGVLGRAPTLAGIPGEGRLREGWRRRRRDRRQQLRRQRIGALCEVSAQLLARRIASLSETWRSGPRPFCRSTPSSL